jgi:hypothetical protein
VQAVGTAIDPRRPIWMATIHCPLCHSRNNSSQGIQLSLRSLPHNLQQLQKQQLTRHTRMNDAHQ